MKTGQKRPKVWHVQIHEHESYAFLPDPDVRPLIRYVRTHPCCVHVACPDCGARPGEPCLGESGKHVAAVHIDRKDLFYNRIDEVRAREIRMAKLAKRKKASA